MNVALAQKTAPDFFKPDTHDYSVEDREGRLRNDERVERALL